MKLPTTITLNNITYSTEALSDEARVQMINLLITQQHIERLEQELAIAKTAQIAYQGAFLSVVAGKAVVVEKKKPTRQRKVKSAIDE